MNETEPDAPDLAPFESPSPAAPPERRLRPLFAAFSHRFANTGLELLALLVLLGITVQPALRDMPGIKFPLVLAFVLVTYFAGFWASPLGATPCQMAGRLKVVDYRGRPLTPWRALLRALAMLALALGATTLAMTPREPMMWAVAVPACAFLFLAALTRRQQAAHDLLVRSVVVYRKAFDAPGGRERLAAALDGSDAEPALGKWRRASGLLRDSLMLVAPVVLAHFTAGIQFDRDLRGRVQYALQNTGGLKAEVQVFYEEFGRLPAGPAKLGIEATRTPYPDGGYYFLDEMGRIVIRFTVLPELTRGTLILTPVPGGGTLKWKCRQEGSIEQGHLPADCRD